MVMKEHIAQCNSVTQGYYFGQQYGERGIRYVILWVMLIDFRPMHKLNIHHFLTRNVFLAVRSAVGQWKL